MRSAIRSVAIAVSTLTATSLVLGTSGDAFAAEGWTYTLINTAPLGAATGSWRPTINNVGQSVYFSVEETVPGSGIWREGIHLSDGVTDQTLLEFTGASGSFGRKS